MSSETKDGGCVLARRQVLLNGAVIAAATAVLRTTTARAAPKISKTAVAYQDHPQGDKRCGKCLQFEPPSSCKLVDGTINPQGYCRIFAPRDQAAAPGPTPADAG